MLSHGSCGAQDKSGPGVGEDGVKSIERASVRKVCRHGDTAGVQTAKESNDEVETGGVRQQHALSGMSHVLQTSGDRTGSLIEPRVGQDDFGLTVEQERERRLIRELLGVSQQYAEQIIVEAREA